MPGGPVNGAYNRVSQKNDAIIIPTVLQMSADAVEYFSNLTCIYDRYWQPDPDKMTLPICMFNVLKISPVYSVETSKKRIVLYEPQGAGNLEPDEMADRLRENVMRSVIDNSVKQPTTYNMEIIVPFQPIGRHITDGVKMVSDMITGLNDLTGGQSDAWENIFSTVFAVSGITGAAANTVAKVGDMDGAAYINMNSLEAMAESCRTLCMKMWTGTQYKYVQITNMTHEKKGTEDDVFRATLTLQEKPVLVVTEPKMKLRSVSRNWAVTVLGAAQGALAAPLVDLTGVRQAADGGVAGGMVKQSLGV